MPTVVVPAIRDNTTIARVACQDSGGSITKLETGEIAVSASRRLFFSRRGIESALGYPMRHSIWRSLKERVENGTVTIADDMTLLVEREVTGATPLHTENPSDADAGYTTQRYRTKVRTTSPQTPANDVR